MEFETFHHPDELPELPPSAQPEPQPVFSDADLCDRYVAAHQPTLFAEGRFWRCPHPHRPWQPVADNLISRELLAVFQDHQAPGLRPTTRRLNNLLDLLRRRLDELTPEAWDNPAGFYPFATRLHAVGDLEESKYPPAHHVATTFPYDYVYGATAPAWEGFLAATLPHAAQFLQEFAGYCLLPDNRHELSLWLYGPPRSGKATCLLGLQTLLGPFAGTLSLPEISTRRLDPAYLRRKQLLVCHEPPLHPATVGFFSSLVSGEPLTLLRPYRPSVTVTSTARLALTFHTLPSPEPRFSSLYHRAALVIFSEIPDGQHDPTLKTRIAQEGPGLFNWARAGLRRLLQRGRFVPPATLIAAAQHLQLSTVTPGDFVQACCLRDPHACTQATILHQAYAAWCRTQGHEPLSAKAVAAEWKREGFESHRAKHNLVFWYGVAVRPEALELLLAPPQPQPAPVPLPGPGPQGPARVL